MKNLNTTTFSRALKLFTLIILCASVFFTSCSHIYYAPNTAHIPLLAEKNEVRINGLITSGSFESFTAGELQLAVAPSKHLGLMMNIFSGGKTEDTGDNITESGNGTYFEIAPGYFTASSNKKWIAEAYGGLGTGGINNDYGSFYHSKVGFTKLFMQPAVGFKSKYFEVALSPKLSFVSWKVKQENIGSPKHEILAPGVSVPPANKYISQYDQEAIAGIRSNPSFVAFEPAIIFRGGIENVKLELGVSFSDVHRVPTETAVSTFGISINFNKPKGGNGVMGDSKR